MRYVCFKNVVKIEQSKERNSILDPVLEKKK